MPRQVEPANDMFFPIGGRNQRQDRMIIGGAEDLDNLLILQVPKEFAAFDRAINLLLESGAGKRFKEGAGQRQMHPPNILVGPERARNAVDGKKNLLRLPWLIGQQILEIAGWLVQI